MYNGKRVLALIPARGRNDGIEHMNMREFGGRPLIHYTIRLARQCEFIDHIVVSTEDQSIAVCARAAGIDVPVLRNPTLAGVDADMEDVISETLQFWEPRLGPFDYLLNLYPNVPFKTRAQLLRFLARLEETGADTIVPVFRRQNFFWHVDGDDQMHLLLDGERGSRVHARTKYEELGGVYAHNLGSKRAKTPGHWRLSYCEVGVNESRTIRSVYDMLVLERLTRLPDAVIEQILASD